MIVWGPERIFSVVTYGSQLPKVQKKLKVPRAALGSLSEAARVFDSDLLPKRIGQ